MALSLKKKNDDAGEGRPKRSSRGVRSPKKVGAAGKGDSKAKSGGKGAKRFVLIIGDEGAILIFMHGSRVVRRLFAPSAQASHCEAMTEIMRSNPAVPIYVLTDVLDQQYIPQTFPPVSSLSVGGLVKRRLDRDFQPDDLKGSLPLGRDKTGRKEWKFLLVSLAKTPLITEWLNLLVELPNELKGIYLVPIEAVSYITALGRRLSGEKPRPWQLLISHNKVSGFRQVVVHDGRLVFTRVSQAIDDAIPAVIAGNVEQEIINTIEYLKRLDFRENSDLEATVIISQDVIESLDLNRFGFARANAMTPMTVAETLGLEQAALSADRFGDVVMAAAFGIANKRMLRFSNAYIDRLAKLYKARVGVKAFAGVVVLASLAMSLMTFIGMMSNYSEISSSKKKVQSLEPELQKARKAVDSLNQDVAFKSAIVATYDVYLKDLPQPEDFVKEMMPLTGTSQRVTEFSWKNEGASATGGLPIKITMKVDFSGGGNTLDVVEKTANDFVEVLKTKLTHYEVIPETFPWQKDQGQSSETLEINAASAITVAEPSGLFNLNGIKKSGAAPSGGPGAP